MFRAMLASGMQESIKNECPIIDFSYDCVHLAIEYCYDIDIDDCITPENGEDLLRFADKYQIFDLHVSRIHYFLKI